MNSTNNIRIATAEENQEYARLMEVQKEKELAYYKAKREVSEYNTKMMHAGIIINGK